MRSHRCRSTSRWDSASLDPSRCPLGSWIADVSIPFFFQRGFRGYIHLTGRSQIREGIEDMSEMVSRDVLRLVVASIYALFYHHQP